MATAKKLTKKQALFVKLVNEGMPAYKAALQAYDTDDLNTANTIAVENMQKPTIKAILHKEMQNQGIDIPAIVKPVADGLKAEKIHTSPTEPDVVVPDHTIRLQSVKIASRWIGLESAENQGGDIHYHLHQAEQREKYDL